MEKRKFYKDKQGNYYVLVSNVINLSSEECYVVRDLYKDNPPLILTQKEFEYFGFEECTQYDIYRPAGDNYEEKEKVAARLGIGYYCPFCGGNLRWESDFMMSELGGVSLSYVEVTDDILKNDIDGILANQAWSNLATTCDDMQPFFDDVDNGDYQYIYIKCGDKYYQINDACVGIYKCTNCGKSYEVCDCLPSEQSEYPYYDAIQPFYTK